MVESENRLKEIDKFPYWIGNHIFSTEFFIYRLCMRMGAYIKEAPTDQ